MSELIASTAADCLDLEDLAAFADGRLTGAERDRAVEHLADCDRCYEILAEVVQLQEEEGETDDEEAETDDEEAWTGPPLAEVVEHPASRSWKWPAAGAAAAAVALWLAAPLLRDAEGPLPAPGWDERHAWGQFRGTPSDRLSPEESAFRIGVLAVDLEVALAGGRAERAASLCSRIEDLLGIFDGSLPQRERYRHLHDRLRAGEPPADLRSDAETAEEYLERLPFEPPHYALGHWAEQGRKAALVGDERFFKRRETRRFLRELESIELTPKVSAELETLRQTIVARSPEDLEAVERALARLIAFGGDG